MRLQARKKLDFQRLKTRNPLVFAPMWRGRLNHQSTTGCALAHRDTFTDTHGHGAHVMQKESDAHWTMADARRWWQRAEVRRRSRSGGSDAIDVATVAAVRAVAAARGGEAARETTTSRRRVRGGEDDHEPATSASRLLPTESAARAPKKGRIKLRGPGPPRAKRWCTSCSAPQAKKISACSASRRRD